jgi:hypothetical protein
MQVGSRRSARWSASSKLCDPPFPEVDFREGYGNLYRSGRIDACKYQDFRLIRLGSGVFQRTSGKSTSGKGKDFLVIFKTMASPRPSSTKTIPMSSPLIISAILSVFLVQSAIAQPKPVYDLVLAGGRVIDPETKLDAVRNLGISNGHIAMVSTDPLQGKETVNVSGLVVAPGFIDLHVHGRTNREQEYQAHDGVTTALELEWGIEYPSKWYATRQGKAIINFGASVNWGFNRFRALPQFSGTVDSISMMAGRGELQLENLFNFIRPSYSISLDPEQTGRMLSFLRSDLNEGAIGIGLPIGYVTAAKADELYQVYKFSGETGATIFTHVREPGMLSIQEAIADAVLTGAPLHIVHINSMSLAQIPLAISMIQQAQRKGFDITTEMYPYTAASTLLQSALFNEGWRERLSMDYSDLQWVATGERLTKETFQKYRASGGAVIMHMMKPEWISSGIATEGTMIASDGMPYAPRAHPRTAGTFSRVLGKYVREDKALSLPEAIAKMTLLPAKRLEGIAPMMRFKGRVQVGSDADITVFDPATVADKATFEKGLKFSEGITHVLVNGIFVVRKGETVPNSFPGQAVYGKYKR